MSLNHFVNPNANNKFCKLKNLRNESDVEQFFVIELLKDLGFTEDYIATKQTIPEKSIGKGRKRKNYRPDYITYLDKGHKKPVLLIDAKSPSELAEEGVSDSQLYASVLRRKLDVPKPEQYCIGTNGMRLIIKHYDSDKVEHELTFTDFNDGNKKYEKLIKVLHIETLRKGAVPVDAKVSLVKPPIGEIEAVFHKCHNLIFKRESLLPTQAFYEFSKLIFLKMNEDKKLHDILNTGRDLTLGDFHYHTHWIDANLTVAANPVNDILFKRLVDELEDLVDKKKKKPIFERGEQIKLKPSTIRDVINMLQDYDLYGIDVDLNGRMFEVFLAAVVRGKKLGAYFTPRHIVKLMVMMADVRITTRAGRSEIETVLDGCCGSGGFLIDAMAYLINEIKTNPVLSHNATQLIDELVTRRLYGIDINPDIARIARINMYLHGDGGSNIYRANTLDKEIRIERGEDKATRNELEELKRLLIEDNMKFDVIITNPPFATSYKSKDAYERKIIAQYADSDKIKNLTYKNGTKNLKPEVKSNVLFIARYHDLLKLGGRLIIVVDNSLLNSVKFAEYRVWLKNNFIVRAIISLPKYSFIQAGAGGVTSILYLERRKSAQQKQPKIFARKVRYTGISKSGKEIPENDLPDVLKEWKRFEATGKLYLKGKQQISDYSNDTLFLIDELSDRMDVDFYTPSYRRLMKKVSSLETKGTHRVLSIEDFDTAPIITKEEAEGHVFRYADIGAIDLERCEIIPEECEEAEFEELPNRARIHVKENDVIFPLSYDSLGKVAIIPKDMEGQLVSTGFMAIRLGNYDDAVYLWALIRSETMQKQFHHVASGYTQRGMSKEHLEDYIRFPIPKEEQKQLVEQIKNLRKEAVKARQQELEAYDNIGQLMIKSAKQPSVSR